MRVASSLLILGCLALSSTFASAANLPSGFSEVAISGSRKITRGTSMAFSPDGKLYILEQGGTIEVYQGSGASTWTRVRGNFFAKTPLIVDDSGERGLLGIAFDPNYINNRFVYVYYTTATPPVRNRIARYKANAAGTVALAGSARTIMNLEPLSSATNHNGGCMQFGPDGKLYVAVGDNANSSNAQSLENRLGKILRLNPRPSNPIPGNNPARIDGLGNTSGVNRAIWCAGLRNPFTFAFKPGTNLMYINDVGQSSWEEINVGARGVNFGWPATQGPFAPASFPSYAHPLVYYSHHNGSQSFPPHASFTGSCITGSTFYLPANNTFGNGYQGDYFFADFIGGWIRRYDPNTGVMKRFATNIRAPVAICIGEDGALYYLARNAAGAGRGRVFRVQRD